MDACAHTLPSEVHRSVWARRIVPVLGLLMVLLGLILPAGAAGAASDPTTTLAEQYELLDALKAADVDDRVRLATQNLYQALIDAETHAAIGAGPWERTEDQVASGRSSGSAG